MRVRGAIDAFRQKLPIFVYKNGHTSRRDRVTLKAAASLSASNGKKVTRLIRWLTIITVAALTAAVSLGASANAEAGPSAPSRSGDAAIASALMQQRLSAPAALEERIGSWIAALAEEPEFAEWKHAVWRTYPIGPGTHGWVALLEDDAGREIGYLVVTASPDGAFELVEYGRGGSPLFSSRTLERALASEGLEGVAFTSRASVERLYMGAMHAVWKVTERGITRYADAKTGVWLPIGDDDVAKVASPKFEREELSGKRLHIIKASADPYLDISWLDAPDASIRSWSQFAAWLDGRAGVAIYAARAFGGTVLTPLGVAGYHVWPAAEGPDADEHGSMRAFVALDEDGLRYVPLQTLLHAGTFR